MVVASLLYAVCLYRAYGALDTLSPYIYYELLLLALPCYTMMSSEKTLFHTFKCLFVINNVVFNAESIILRDLWTEVKI